MSARLPAPRSIEQHRFHRVGPLKSVVLPLPVAFLPRGMAIRVEKLRSYRRIVVKLVVQGEFCDTLNLLVLRSKINWLSNQNGRVLCRLQFQNTEMNSRLFIAMHYVLVQERLAERICMIHFKTVSVNITASEYFPFTLEACPPTSLMLRNSATLYSPQSVDSVGNNS